MFYPSASYFGVKIKKFKYNLSNYLKKNIFPERYVYNCAKKVQVQENLVHFTKVIKSVWDFSFTLYSDLNRKSVKEIVVLFNIPYKYTQCFHWKS